MSGTVIILGDSPFLQSIQDRVSYLVDKYYTVGINNIVSKYPIHTHIFQDMPFIKLSAQYPDVHKVTLAMYGEAILPEKELYDSYSYNFSKNSEEDILLEGKLAWCGFTHDYAISYCIVKGYKRIILCGAADFVEGEHFATDEEFRYSEKLKMNSKRFIEEVASKKALIETLNADSILDIPRVSIDSLLS